MTTSLLEDAQTKKGPGGEIKHQRQKEFPASHPLLKSSLVGKVKLTGGRGLCERADMTAKMQPKAWVNGTVSDAKDAKVSVFDRGFLFGDGVYETGRSYDRTFVFLEEHWRRLRLSAAKLSIPLPWSDAELEKGLFEVAEAFGQSNVYFRTILTRGPIETVGIEVFSDNPPTLVHLIQHLDEAKLTQRRSEGVQLLTSSVIRNASDAQDPNIKTSNYLNSLLALQDVKRRGAEDAVMCDRKGHVTEGTTFSLFGVTREGTLITPPLDVGILDSITRRHVLEQAQGLLPTKEGRFTVQELLDCQEAFIASSVREIVPIKSWDGKTYPTVPGKFTLALQRKLRTVIDDYVKSHRKF